MKDEINSNKDVLSRMRAGEAVPMDDPGYHIVGEAVNRTRELSVQLNNSTNMDQIRAILGEIIGRPVDETTTVFTPFYTNYGGNIILGRNVFINHLCSFLDLGGITIEDNVMVGPRVSISSENHPVSISDRKTLVPAAVTIRKNAWIGAGAIILPGVTVGENSVVAAGAVVREDVPDNTVVGGIPARELKKIK